MCPFCVLIHKRKKKKKKLSEVRGNILYQVKSLFDSFAKSLGARFSTIDSKFSQVMSASASKVDDNVPVCSDVSLDVLTPSISAPSAVAGRSEPTPDGAPLAPYTGSLGTTLGGLAAVDVPTGGSSLSRLSFEDLMVAVRVSELSGGYVPDNFLDSLHDLVVFSSDCSFVVSGDSLAKSVLVFRVRASDPVNPTTVPSRGGDSIVPFLCNLVSVSVSLPPPPPPHWLVELVVFAQLWVLGP